MSNGRLKIGICGGGIASLCIAHALAKYPHLDVKIFEKSETLRDEGASVGLGENALQALALISSNLRRAVDDAGGVPMDPPLRVMLATRANNGRFVCDISKEVYSQVIVYWGALYHALYDRIPGGLLVLGKGVVKIEEDAENDCIRMHFEDGTTHDADVVIGCDGLNSVVRQAVLGPESPANKIVWSDRYNHRVVIPMDQARDIFGDEYCRVPTQYGWIGDNVLLLTDHANNSTAMQVISDLPIVGAWPFDGPFGPWSKEQMERMLVDQCGDVGAKFAKAFSSQPTLYAGRLRVHPETPTFCKGRICVAGDAALAFFPGHGAGAGQAIEDALILSTVLGVCSSRADTVRALKVYDAVRRPRRTAVAELSSRAMQIICGIDPECGTDPDRLAYKFSRWGNDIISYDLVGSQQDALAQMAREA